MTDGIDSIEGPTCPYCQTIITPDEPHYYDSFSYNEDECPTCEKKFKVEVETITSWATMPMEEGSVHPQLKT